MHWRCPDKLAHDNSRLEEACVRCTLILGDLYSISFVEFLIHLNHRINELHFAHNYHSAIKKSFRYTDPQKKSTEMISHSLILIHIKGI